MHLKLSRLLAMAAVAIGFATSTQVVVAAPSFMGPYALSIPPWMMTSGSNDGGTTIDITDPTTLKFNGGDTVCAQANTCFVQFSILVTHNGSFNFDWSFSTDDLDDIDFIDTYEQFGYVVNGIPTQLTQPNVGLYNGVPQSVAVLAGQTFGFFYDCTDCEFRPGMASVTNFSATVATAQIPEPGTWALMLVGIGLLGMTSRRRLVK